MLRSNYDNEAGDELTCPNGETTKTRYRDGKDHGWVYHFKASQCRNCPLRNKCIATSKQTHRKVSKNDFQSQYNTAKQRATTEAYKQVRKQHPGIERKLNELVRWHDGRHVRYRGRLRVKVQYLLLGIVVNCKRIVRLLTPAPAAQPAKTADKDKWRSFGNCCLHKLFKRSLSWQKARIAERGKCG